MQQIVDVHFPKIEQNLIDEAMRIFYNIREIKGLKKKPSTSELMDWIHLLKIGGADVAALEALDIAEQLPPQSGALLKNEQDIELLAKMKKGYQRKFY